MGQHDVGSLLQKGPHPPIATFRDAAKVVDLPGLVAPGDQAQIGADVSGMSDARRIIDCGHKGEHGKLPDARDGHEPMAGHGSFRHAPYVGIDGGDRRHNRGSRRNQSPHGREETGRPPNTTARPRI